MSLIVPSKTMEVRKSEALLNARYQLSELAIKLVSIIYSNVKRSDENGKDYQIRVADIAKLVNKDYGEMYNLIKNAVDELLENPIRIEDKENKKWVAFNWISDALYEEGVISFTISKRLKPHILELQKKYLKYRLENILNLKGSYVIRIYETLKNVYNLKTKYGNLAEEIIKVEELREMLEVPRSYPYGGSSGIKKRILEKAKKEFEEHTDIIFDYKEIKTGRKVTHLKFIIRKNPTKTEEYIESKINYNLKSVRHFVSFLRKNYIDRSFGYALIAGNICWLKINDKGLVYGVLDSGEKKHFNNIESEKIYNNWWEIAKANWFYQTVILENMRDFREVHIADLDFRLNLNQTIEYLKEENILK